MEKELQFSQITESDEIQTRVTLNKRTVKNYADLMIQGVVFPPMKVYTPDNGHTFYLADGYHRKASYELNKKTSAMFEIEPGTIEDAILWNIEVNVKNGLRMTNADKQKAVMTILKNPKLSTKSDRDIGNLCGVDHKTVGKYRLQELKKQTGENEKEPKPEKAPESEKEHKETLKEENARLYQMIARLDAIITKQRSQLETANEKIAQMKQEENSYTFHGKINRKELMKLIHPDIFQDVLKKQPNLLENLTKATAILNEIQ